MTHEEFVEAIAEFIVRELDKPEEDRDPRFNYVMEKLEIMLDRSKQK
jgi:hypothetical protein